MYLIVPKKKTMTFKLTHDNSNATLIKVDKLHDLPNLDKLKAIQYAGFSALVSVDSIKEWDLVLFIPTLTSIDPDYLRDNNLYGSKSKNKDTNISGYFPNSGIVKAIKLKKNISNAFVVKYEDFIEYYKPSSNLELGMSFNEVDGKVFCFKYEPPTNTTSAPSKKEEDRKYIPVHFDTHQFLRELDNYKPEDTVYITQKLHGTSVILWHTYVSKKPTFRQRLFHISAPEREMWYMASSRRVIKTSNSSANHYYGSDIWSECLKKYEQQIPKNCLIYGEIIGWIWDEPIQKGYTYNLPQGQRELYVYRVAFINEDGMVIDLPFETMQAFCSQQGFKVVPLLEKTTADKIVKEHERYLDKVYSSTYKNAVPLSDNNLVDEGIVIRRDDYPTPYNTKLKSPLFYEYETKNIDDLTLN